MTDYEKLYHLLFNAITDALGAMERSEYAAAAELLKDAQCEAE